MAHRPEIARKGRRTPGGEGAGPQRPRPPRGGTSAPPPSACRDRCGSRWRRPPPPSGPPPRLRRSLGVPAGEVPEVQARSPGGLAWALEGLRRPREAAGLSRPASSSSSSSSSSGTMIILIICGSPGPAALSRPSRALEGPREPAWAPSLDLRDLPRRGPHEPQKP